MEILNKILLLLTPQLLAYDRLFNVVYALGILRDVIINTGSNFETLRFWTCVSTILGIVFYICVRQVNFLSLKTKIIFINFNCCLDIG
jgi:hypothetical protein